MQRKSIKVCPVRRAFASTCSLCTLSTARRLPHSICGAELNAGPLAVSTVVRI